MRTLVTFILRPWVDPQADKPAWEGRIEEATGGERAHVRSPEELARFIDAQTAECRTRRPEAQEEGNEQKKQRSESDDEGNSHRRNER